MQAKAKTFRSKLEGIEAENVKLKMENLRLLKNIQILEEDKTISESLRAESFVASLANGLLSTHNASFDIDIDQGKLYLEVKFSRLNVAARKIGAPTKRWAWAKPLGESGHKQFDHLILIGITDSRYTHRYLDPSNKFVIFDVPYAEILPLTIQTNAGRYRSIQLTTNPDSAKSTASPLFVKYQITSKELEKRYKKYIVTQKWPTRA